MGKSELCYNTFMKTTELKFKKELYPKEALMKAAYSFIDRCYIHVDFCNEEYVVEMTEKGNADLDTIALEFENELLAQTVRFQVYLQTHTIREVLMAIAMSSTIVGDNTELEKDALPDNIDDLDNILEDWFEKNER